MQGLALYDTWNAQLISGNQFWDYISKEDDAHRHAVGSHLNNQFEMSIKNMVFVNNTFHNCDRAIQMPKINATGDDINGDQVK